MTAASFLLTLFSAVLYVLSFPPVSAFPLAWTALAPFFLVVTQAPPHRAAGYGVLWGLMMTGGVAWCLPAMLTNYFGVSGVVGWVGLLVAGVGLAGMYSGAFALWLSWMARRRLVFPWLVAAAWGTCEFARANPFIGTPWALVGYSQTSWTRLMQIADATGPYGVGMLIAAVNACLAGAITPLLRGRRFAVSCVLVGVAMGGALIYGEWRLTQTFASGDPVPVAVVQGAIERKLRWDPERREANLGLYFALTKETAPVHPRLIFWPENAVDFYLQEAVPESEAVLRITRDLGTSLILGGPYYGHGVTGRYYHNSVFLIRKGRMTDRYDKIRLLPFAETGQFKEIFPKKPLNLKPGRRFQTLRAEDLRVGAFICFEAMYPDLVRSFALQGAEVLVNPSNDDWFDSAASARHQLDIAAVRAIENRRYLIRPTATGFSAIIDPYGRTVVRSGFGAPEVLTASVYPSRVRTPYQQWGDATAWGAVMFVAFASLFLLLTKDDKNDEGGKL